MEKIRSLKLIPSLASANPLNLIAELDRLAGISDLHLDIEDGHFTPSITFGMKTIDKVVDYVGKEKNLDVHLQVTNPKDWIDKLAAYDAIKKIAISVETLRYPLEALQHIKDHGIEAGLALNFITPAKVLAPFAEQLDFVIVMTAEPDGLGMRFNPVMLEKIKKAANILGSKNKVWADGNVGEDTIKRVFDAGASTVVLGRTMFREQPPKQIICTLTKACGK